MGRKLTALSNSTDSITYNYNANGHRISKTVNGVTTEFYYDDRGALILSSCSDGTNLYFYPDADGSIGSFKYNNEQYYYVRNAQNDILGITDKNGNFVAKYTYDEWGVITSITDGQGNDVSTNSSHIANLNPYRYRSYFYDAETGFYWLNTRYYDPAIGRFINADGAETIAATLENTVQYNLFAYCFNNPINLSDDNGAWPKWAKKLVAAVAVVAVVATVAAVTVATAGTGTAAAAIAIGAAKGAAIGMASGAISGAAGGAVSHRISTGSWEGAGEAALNGMGDGALSGAITGTISGAASAGLRYGTFSSKSSLTQHFAKHGDEFGDMYTNAKEYAQGAKYVIKNGTYIPEKNAYIRFLGTQGKANYAFVGMKAGGRVSTYHVRSVSKMIRDGVSMFY